MRYILWKVALISQLGGVIQIILTFILTIVISYLLISCVSKFKFAQYIIGYSERKKMIPKIIHYCWFGRNPLPKSAIKCIESWKQFFPDYQIKEWNEDNFNVNITPYTREAYEKKKICFCERLC